MKRTLVILAAGLGSRYGGLKQMEGFGPRGETLLDYSVYDGLQNGFNRVVFVIRKGMEADFHRMVLHRFADRIEVELVYQESELTAEDAKRAGGVPDRKKPWGTGHALLSALPVVREPFLVLNADDFYGPLAFGVGRDFLHGIDPGARRFGLIGYRLEQTLSAHGQVSRGVLSMDEKHQLTGIREHHQIERVDGRIQYSDTESGQCGRLNAETLVSLNLLATTPAIQPIAQQAWERFLGERGTDPRAEFGIPNIMEAALDAESLVEVVPTEETWMGVTHASDAPEVRERLAERVRRGDYPDPLWAWGE